MKGDVMVWFSDALEFAGLCLVVAGVAIIAGVGWALIAAGAGAVLYGWALDQ